MRFVLFSYILLLISSCSESYFDKGKEFTIVEDSITTPFRNVFFEKSITCKECHENIYNEFTNSMHYKSTIFRDEIHNAVWEQHPNFKNKTNYNCAQCHAPASDNIEAFMTEGKFAFPDKNNESQNEAISCATCHRIKSIEKHRKANRNIFEEDFQTYYGIGDGMSHNHSNKNDNKIYFNGDVCMGCHSHKENSKDYIVGITENKTKGKTYETCITCHMPQVAGTGTNVRNFKKHFFHGFAGAHSNQEILAKHVEFSVEKISKNKIKLRIKNNSSHDLFSHPLRKSFLKMNLIRNGKSVKEFETIQMERILENKKGVAGCTETTKETKNTLIKGDKTTIITLEFPLQKNDKLKVEFGYQLVKEEFIEKLNLNDNSTFSEYRLLKKEIIELK